MKKFFIYALTYIGITSTVATTVTLVGPAIIKTSDTVGSNDEDDEIEDEEEEEEDIFEVDDVSCMISGLTSMRYVNISNAAFNIYDSKEEETYKITLSNLYATIDIEGLMTGDFSGLNVQGTLGINAYGLDVAFDFAYSDVYNAYTSENAGSDRGGIYVAPELTDDPYGKCIFLSKHYNHVTNEGFNPYLSAKIYTNDLIDGLNRVLREFNIEMPELNMDMDMDSESLIAKMTSMVFEPVSDTNYHKATLDLGDMFELGTAIPVDLYCVKEGSGFEKKVSLRRGVINEFEMNGFAISGELDLQTYEDTITIVQPDARDYYVDYSRAFDLFDSIMALTKKESFGMEFEFLLDKDGTHYGSFGGNAILNVKGQQPTFQANLGVELFGNKINMQATYQDNNMYFDLNGLLKTKINVPTMGDILDYLKQTYGSDSAATCIEAFVSLVQNTNFKELISGNLDNLEDFCSRIFKDGGDIIAELQADLLGLGDIIKGKISVVIDEETKAIKAIYFDGCDIYSYLEDCYYNVTAIISLAVDDATEAVVHYLEIFNEYVDIADHYYELYKGYVDLGIEYFNKAYSYIDGKDFTDAAAWSNLFEEILDATGMKKFAANFDVDICNVIDGARTDTTMSVSGFLQVDMTDAFNTEHPTKTYGMKLYASVDIFVVDHPDKIHKVELQIIHDVVYVSYMDKLKFQMNLTSIAEIIMKIMELTGTDTSKVDKALELNEGGFGNIATDTISDTSLLSVEDTSNSSLLAANSITNIVDAVMQVKDMLRAFKEYEFDNENGNYSVTLDGDYLGLGGDLTLKYNKGTENGDCLTIHNIRNGIDAVDIVMYFVDYDETKYMSTNLDDYFDFNTLTTLLDFGIKDLDRTYFRLTGTATISIIGIINFNINVDVQIWVDDNKELTIKIDLSNLPNVGDVTCVGAGILYNDEYKHTTNVNEKTYTTAARSADISDRKASIYIQNNMVYIERSQKEKFTSGGFLGIGAKTVYETYYRHAICTLDEFLNTDFILYYMFETIIDLTETVQNSILESITPTDINDMNLEDVLSEYYMTEGTNETKFTFGFDLDALSKDSSAFSDEYLYLYANENELYKLDFSMSIVSVIDMSATLTLADTQKDDIASVNEYIASFAQYDVVVNETYHETASHPFA